MFPVPPPLAIPTAGIDISTGSVKCALLGESVAGTVLKTYCETNLPEGVIVGGDIEQKDTIVEILRSLRLRNGIRHVHACLPEKKAYLYQVLVPGDGGGSLRAGVEFDLETHVPLPPSETVFDFEAVRRVESGVVVSVTAYAKRIVNDYQEVFERAGITLRSLEVESQSLARSIIGPEEKNGVMMLIDFGRRTTRIAIAENGSVAFTATVDIGGETLTSAVMKHFNVKEDEAEKIKNDKGFLMNKENKNLVEALMTTVSVVKDEVVSHITYWNSPHDDLPRKPIEKIIICGGNANLRGFPEYLEGAVGVPVSVANVWINAFSLDRYVPPMHFTDSLEYATAIGLALRGKADAIW